MSCLAFTSTELAYQWTAIDESLTIIARIVAEAGDEHAIDEIRQSLSEIAGSLEIPGIEQLEQQVQLMERVSRHLRPASRALQSALRVVAAIRDSSRSWQNVL